MAKKVISSKKPTSFIIHSSYDLGEHIKFARTTSGISIIDAAALCNVSKKTYGDIEKGKETVSVGNILNALFSFGIKLEVCSENVNEK